MRKVVPIIVVVSLFLLGVFLLSRHREEIKQPAGPVLTASFLPAELGNAVVFIMPDGRALVVDPGYTRTIGELVEYLRAHDVGSIDVLITRNYETPPPSLKALFAAFEVRRVMHSGLPWSGSLEGPAGRVAEVLLYGGDSVRLAGNVRLIALYPPKDVSELRDRSLVTSVHFGNTRFLLMSDATIYDEGYLIRSGADLASDVLVVGRNGRYGSTSLELLMATKPSHFVVLVGGGSRRPSRSVMRRIDSENTGAQVYRTDIHGAIQISSDGNSLRVNNVRGGK